MGALVLLSPPAPVHRTPEQLLLPGVCPPGPPTDGLFFAIFPDPTAAASLVHLADRLRARHALSGRPLATGRLHLTLHHFGTWHGLRHDFVEMASEAATKIARPGFRVTFDRVMSFRRNFACRPLVLRGDSHLAPLKKFREDLGLALTSTGLGRKLAKSYTPHVTLLYDEREITGQKVAPVSWLVNEFVLVHSRIGLTEHIPLGRWPLRN